MDRRNFLVAGITGAVVISLPSLHCNTDDAGEHAVFLEACAGREQTMKIGKMYAEKYPVEADTRKLRNLINSVLPEKSNISAVRGIIEYEFTSGKVVIVNGWILSLTEARQAALSFLNS